ncbi:MAG: amidohydrolase family protein, partial [Candidatus Thermoplasmatota archaeon]|nr:amidohydrolase family protein [Candidatus Thermoplasmatota archaeon]
EFHLAPAGMPGVMERLPLLMALSRKNQIPLERVVSSCCEKPGKLLGLNKGMLGEGMDADIAVFDPQSIRALEEGDVASKCGWSPYLGFDVVMPSYVFSRGEMVVESGSFIGEKGHGRYVGRPER